MMLYSVELYSVESISAWARELFGLIAVILLQPSIITIQPHLILVTNSGFILTH